MTKASVKTLSLQGTASDPVESASCSFPHFLCPQLLSTELSAVGFHSSALNKTRLQAKSTKAGAGPHLPSSGLRSNPDPPNWPNPGTKATTQGSPWLRKMGRAPGAQDHY
jgi:hypothetical protein